MLFSDSPLDLRLKAMLICDVLNIAAIPLSVGVMDATISKKYG